MIVPEVKSLILACKTAIWVLGGHAEMVDAEDGRPYPNAALIAKLDLERALNEFTSLHETDESDGRTV